MQLWSGDESLKEIEFSTFTLFTFTKFLQIGCFSFNYPFDTNSKTFKQEGQERTDTIKTEAAL